MDTQARFNLTAINPAVGFILTLAHGSESFVRRCAADFLWRWRDEGMAIKTVTPGSVWTVARHEDVSDESETVTLTLYRLGA